MWKYRSALIFTAAIGFAAETAVFRSPISLIAMVTFLTCHYLDRFFGSERVESKALAQIKAYEDELKAVKNDISRLMMSVGIRGGVAK